MVPPVDRLEHTGVSDPKGRDLPKEWTSNTHSRKPTAPHPIRKTVWNQASGPARLQPGQRLSTQPCCPAAGSHRKGFHSENERKSNACVLITARNNGPQGSRRGPICFFTDSELNTVSVQRPSKTLLSLWTNSTDKNERIPTLFTEPRRGRMRKDRELEGPPSPSDTLFSWNPGSTMFNRVKQTAVSTATLKRNLLRLYIRLQHLILFAYYPSEQQKFENKLSIKVFTGISGISSPHPGLCLPRPLVSLITHATLVFTESGPS